MMTPIHPDRDFYILDALANDVEDVSSILQMLNSDSELGWHKELGRKFTCNDVAEGLSRLVRLGSVQVYLTDDDEKALIPLAEKTLPLEMSVAWFGLTGRGRLIHENWKSG